MKLLRYGPAGAEKPGILDNDGQIRDLSAHVSDIGPEQLSPEGLARLRAVDVAGLPVVIDPRLGACVAGVGKIVCIGLNYRKHAEETGSKIPEEPIVFLKATTSLNGPDDPIIVPYGSVKTDWEIELGVVIGQRATLIEEASALDYVAGYCTTNDVSERHFQSHRGGQWTKGKSADSFGPIGPWLVTSDEVPDPQQLDLWCDVNGERLQSSSTADMIFDVRFVVSYLSQFMTLMPGDVIMTGTPSGVGAGFKPQRFLKAGDHLRCGVTGLGEQSHAVIDFRR
ncbi:fumarylacetoacetate hydrolase family protein [Microvirga alba]|uniref:Fumarylacetoacetate hydrolase family protein n=1 Tax=Microvirga alba TaxID=2791025 RepID=A0A931BMA8_9HYPH|nr:fumarylacetoacetate hydrolase family protein [Microvirga alba]MBF9233866.1 fumarylacetoacetate hydrolase family protein [Microvirga alba]